MVRTTISDVSEIRMARYVEKHLSWFLPDAMKRMCAVSKPRPTTALNMATNAQPHIMDPYSRPT